GVPAQEGKHMLGCRPAIALALIVGLGFPVWSRGAAQLAAGATTSAQPTSVIPSVRKMQLTFDPDVEATSDVPGTRIGGPYNVTAFQLSVQFDASKVHVASLSDIQFIAPYDETVVIPIGLAGEVPPPAGPSQSAVIDN